MKKETGFMDLKYCKDCGCGYRFSLPIIAEEEEIKKYSGYLDETGEEAKR